MLCSSHIIDNLFMYTGIIPGTYPVTKIEDKPGLRTLTVAFSDVLVKGLEIGASVSITGVCLTVKTIDENAVAFDAMQETLDKTTIGELQVGDQVNVERSWKMGEENGGHEIYGHVTGTVEIKAIRQPENNHVLVFQAKPECMKYLMPKGFVALDGASLTVSNPDKKAATFEVWLIPETLERTTFSEKKVGDRVNLELHHQTQTIVDTVERVMADRMKKA